MATKIRLARAGAKKRPFYRIVVADVRSPRDGNFIEKIGTYNPLLDASNPERLVIKKDRAEYWLGTGATPTERILTIFEAVGIQMVTGNQKTLADKKVKSIELSKARKAAEEKKKAEEARKAEEKAKKEAAASEAAA